MWNKTNSNKIYELSKKNTKTKAKKGNKHKIQYVISR